MARSLTLGLPALEIAGRSSWAATIPGRDWEKAPSPEADMVVAAKAATSP